MNAGGRKIRVLIVDDSSIVRTLLTHILTRDGSIEVVGQAPDPYVARELMVKLKPDVMTLDIEMPRMDGVTFLEKVMTHMPTPTIILSSLSKRGSELALRAAEAGAVEVLTKPAVDLKVGLEALSVELIAKVKAASGANLLALKPFRPRVSQVAKLSSETALAQTTHQILAIAASTGGTEALKSLLSQMPADIPGTLVVQHMPALFTKSFAESLGKLCPFEVREAQEGDRVFPGRVLVAPGGFHMELARSGAQYFVRLNQEPPVHSVRPAADPLFASVSKVAGKNAVGVVLTGMGKDGAVGLLQMHQAGARTFAQDERSCVVYGMPKEAVERGAVDHIVPLTKLPEALLSEFRKRRVA
jgi:two-component system, chemotaxis family, protein-glutamate methylesterase/glutaminase